eukprot:160074_1
MSASRQPNPNKIYKSLSFLGRGAFGDVYKGKDQSNHYVAIKRVSYDDYKSIQQEVSVLKQCNSKYVIKLLNVHNDFASKRCWIILESVYIYDILNVFNQAEQ